MAPSNDQQYLMGRSASGAPLMFPLLPEPNVQETSNLIKELELEGKKETRFSTSIYQILERVSNKVRVAEKQKSFLFLLVGG